MAGKTSDYYKKNPAAAARRVKQQAKYNKTKKATDKRVELNLNNLIAMTSSEAKRLWRRSIKEHFNSTCVYCGKTYDSNVLTLDHVHPRSRGGQDITSNVVCACRKCNQAKGSRNWLQWMRSTFGTCPLRENLILSHIQ